MAIRKVMRAGKPVLFIDIRWRDAAGHRKRYRRDAQVQSTIAARAEERRLLAYLGEHGELPNTTETSEDDVKASFTFAEMVKRYKATAFLTKKPSTRAGYREVLEHELLVPLLSRPLVEIDSRTMVELDAKLVQKKLSPSRRRNFHVAIRSVLRAAIAEGFIAAMPQLPKLPKVGRTVVDAFPTEWLPKVLAVASPAARLAIALAAYAGLRAGEVRGLRWGDVDLRARTLVVRRAITRREEAPPKSGHARLVPIAEPLLPLLAAARRQPAEKPVAPTERGKVWGEYGLLQAFRRACRRAGAPEHSFHSLRHCFVTELLRRGAAAHAVKALAGHSSLAVTERYAHAAVRDLHSAIAVLGQ